MPQNAFFPRNCDLLVSQKTMQRHFFPTLHPLSPVIFATATVVVFVLLRNSWFNFHCYTQCEATPTQKSALEWCCDLSCLLAWKITKGIHSCKPASLNHPNIYIYIYIKMSIDVWSTLPIFLPIHLHGSLQCHAKLTYPFTFIKLHVHSHIYFPKNKYEHSYTGVYKYTYMLI